MNRYVKTYTVYYTFKEDKERHAEKYNTMTQAKARIKKLQGKHKKDAFISDPMVGSSIEIINLGG